MSNIVLDANDHTRLRDKSFFLLLIDTDMDEMVAGLDDLSKVAI